MKKQELLNWLQEENRQWESLLKQIGPERMEQPGVAAHWSVKDIIAHLTVWHRDFVTLLQAASTGEPDPPPPWPVHLQTDDEINAWIYEVNRERPVHDLLDESHQLFQQLLAVIEGLPHDVRIEEERHLICLGDNRFPAGEFFNHFHDDHESDIRAWLAQIEEPKGGSK